MTPSTTGGAVDHRAAAAALDEIAALVAQRTALDTRIDGAVRAALALHGVTQDQVARTLGITPRGLRKRLTAG